MKKIKRLELRTGQVLNPLQQSFVVGGDHTTHSWVREGNCACAEKGNSHKVRCTNVEDEWFPDLVGATAGVFLVISGVRIPTLDTGGSGAEMIVSGFRRGRRWTCYADAMYDPETGEHTIQNIQRVSSFIEYF